MLPHSLIPFLFIILLILAPYLAHHLDAIGIAISMNAIAIVGLILSLILVRTHVDLPIAKTFAPPLIAAAIGTGMHFACAEWLNTLPILMGVLAGSAIFTLSYGTGLLIVERKTIIDEIKTVVRAIRS